MKLKGKTAPWFWAILIIGNITMLYSLILPQNEGRGAVLFALALFDLISLPIVLRNYVLVEENKLTVVFGFMKDSIKISEIELVYTTHNPIASSAASLDRVVLKGRRQELMCAVEDKEPLFDALKKQNAQIIVRR